jgi:hypothetical protein
MTGLIDANSQFEILLARHCTICDTKLLRYCERLIISIMLSPQIARLRTPTAPRFSDLNFYAFDGWQPKLLGQTGLISRTKAY